MKKAETREQWLSAGVGRLAPWFGARGYQIPKVRVSVGWPTSRGIGASKHAVGECWDKKASSDGVAQIFVSPRLQRREEVLSALVHELVHAVVGNLAKHNSAFRQCATDVGLTGRMVDTVAGPGLANFLRQVASKLKDYPHVRLNPDMRPTQKQTTRLKKVECPTCHYVARVTSKWLVEMGPPLCPLHATMKMVKRKQT